MSLSLSNSLSFALIPLVKIGGNIKNAYFLDFEVHFHHQGGLKVTQSTKKYPEIPQSTQKNLKVPKSTKKSP